MIETESAAGRPDFKDVEVRTYGKLRATKVRFYLRYFLSLDGTSQGADFSPGDTTRADESVKGRLEPLLRGTGIDATRIENDEELIALSDYMLVVANLLKAAQSSSLALDLAKSLRLNDLGILGYAIASSQTTADAAYLWHKFNTLFFGNLVQLKYITRNKQLIAYYLPFEDFRPELFDFFLEEKILIDVALYKLISDTDYPIEKLELTRPINDSDADFREMIGAPVYYGRQANALFIREHAYDQLLWGRNRETNSVCVSHIETVFNYVNSHTTATMQVLDYLYRHLSESPSMETTALSLKYSPRALAKQLDKEDSSFRDLLLQAKEEMTRTYIGTTNFTAEEIAERLGFLDVNSFRRFVRKSTGKTVNGLRKISAPMDKNGSLGSR